MSIFYIYTQYIYIYTTPYTNPRCTNRRSPNSPLLVASGHEAKLRVAIGFVHHLPSFGTLWLCQQFAIENGHRNSRLIGLCLCWDISMRDILGFLLGVRDVYLGLLFLFQGFYPPVNYTIHPAKWRVGRLVSMK